MRPPSPAGLTLGNLHANRRRQAVAWKDHSRTPPTTPRSWPRLQGCGGTISAPISVRNISRNRAGQSHVAFSALQGEPDAPPLLVITPEQDAAASASIANAVAENAAASAPVVPAPVAPVAPINPPKIVSVAGPAADTGWRHGHGAYAQGVKLEVVGEDVHDAIAKALAWIERGVVAIETGVRKL